MQLLVYKNKIGSIHVIDNKNIGRHHQRWYPPLCQEKKSKPISFASIFAKQPLVKNYRKGRVQGAKFHRLRHLHRAFLLRPFSDTRKHILST
jgi:hypothetical protein